MESWVPAIITGIVSIIVCLINNHRNTNEFFLKQTAQIEDMAAHNEESIAIIETQIDNLRKEVEKHNQIVERVYGLEARADRFCETTKNFTKDIDRLTKSVEKIEDKL